MAAEALLRLQQGITAAVLPMQVCIELEHFLRECHLVDRAIAVRSSAVSEDGPNVSFAGIHRSVLPVRAVDAILYAGPRLSGYEIPHGMQTIKRIDGHAYFDLTALQWCWYDFAGAMPAQTVATIGGHQPEIPVPPGDPLVGSAGRRRKKTRLKIFWRMLGFNYRARRIFQEHLAEVRAVAALPWATLGNDAMLQVIARMVELHERLDPGHRVLERVRQLPSRTCSTYSSARSQASVHLG